MDGVSQDYDLIYRNSLHYTMNVGKFLCYTTVTPTIGLQLYYYCTGTMPVTQTLHNSQVYFNYAEDTPIMLGAFVLMNVLVAAVCHAATLRIYKKDDQ